MKNTLKIVCNNLEPDTPPIVKNAINRLLNNLSSPPQPLMSQDRFELLGKFEKAMLTCNHLGCKNVVSTHGLVCMEHLDG